MASAFVASSPRVGGFLNVRMKVFQFNTRAMSASLTISATPGQSSHPRGPSE